MDKTFAQARSDLYADLAQALPAGKYLRADGITNLVSHSVRKPDIGPKMYSAEAGDATSRGTTRLHLDVCDAFNLMVWSAEEGQASALWHIFQPQHTLAIRTYLLRKAFAALHTTMSFEAWRESADDPIWGSYCYLNAGDLSELASAGIKSYEILQRVGDMIIIPANALHQVCNLYSTIKIGRRLRLAEYSTNLRTACDFVNHLSIDRIAAVSEDLQQHAAENICTSKLTSHSRELISL